MLCQRGRASAQDLREHVFAASDADLPVGRIAAMLDAICQRLLCFQGSRSLPQDRRDHRQAAALPRAAQVDRAIRHHPGAGRDRGAL